MYKSICIEKSPDICPPSNLVLLSGAVSIIIFLGVLLEKILLYINKC